MDAKKQDQRKELAKLAAASAFIGLACAALGDALKMLTDIYEARLFARTQAWPVLCFVFPLFGLSAIYILRYYLFRRRENKGIKEIYDSLKTRHNELPPYKIPSHFVNGLLTVITGGSSGIEVSTVVASASVGSVAHNKAQIHQLFRKEIICAGVAAAVTTLFGSPAAGMLFALEVILKKASPLAIACTLMASASAWLFNVILDSHPLFLIRAEHWNYYALPWFLLLGVLAGLNSAYLTRSVLFFKERFSRIAKTHIRILLGSVLIGFGLLLFPQLYGDGYHAMRELFNGASPQHWSVVIVLGCVALLKPLITSVTLAAGGDGGIFAPSLFIGAFLGACVSLLLNLYLGLSLIPVNFMVAGMAAVLSASLHAPFTAVFLVCGLVSNYNLFVPLMAACLVARITARLVVPYTVYSYSTYKNS